MRNIEEHGWEAAVRLLDRYQPPLIKCDLAHLCEVQCAIFIGGFASATYQITQRLSLGLGAAASFEQEDSLTFILTKFGDNSLLC